jgi:hypothetical protein
MLRERVRIGLDLPRRQGACLSNAIAASQQPTNRPPNKQLQVHHILSELVMGGMVLETNMNEILFRIGEQDKVEKQEAGIAAAPARAVSAMKSMNIPQQIRDIKKPELPSFSNFKNPF